jgi:hypothetical protein
MLSLNAIERGPGAPVTSVALHRLERADKCHCHERRASASLRPMSLRLASIAQGVCKRGLDGNASSEEAMMDGTIGQRLACLAWEIAQKSAAR